MEAARRRIPEEVAVMTDSTRNNQQPADPDYDIRPAAAPDTPLARPIGPSRQVVIGALLIVVAVGAAWWIAFRPGEKQAAQPQAAATNAPHDEALPPLGGTPAAVTVPPLDESDAVVRELVRQLTSNPTVAAWLATDGLIRNFTVATVNIADGASPEKHLRRLRPSEPFAVLRQGNQFTIDPASYRRFNKVAAAASSINPDGAAKLYATLKPRIEEAYRDLGHPDTPFDRAVEQAIIRLLRTPIVEQPPRVAPGTRGIGYVFVDPDLEALTGAQKQLIRMGPENMRAIQQALRAIAISMGIPPARLPEPSTATGEGH
jgi:DUF3014 family protein